MSCEPGQGATSGDCDATCGCALAVVNVSAIKDLGREPARVGEAGQARRSRCAGTVRPHPGAGFRAWATMMAAKSPASKLFDEIRADILSLSQATPLMP